MSHLIGTALHTARTGILNGPVVDMVQHPIYIILSHLDEVGIIIRALALGAASHSAVHCVLAHRVEDALKRC